MKQPLHTQIAQNLACVLVYLFIVSSAFAAGERNTFDPRQFSTGKFHTCPPEGHARRFDPYLDALKNRDLPPPSVLRQGYTVPQLINALPGGLPKTKFNRSRWSKTDQDTAAVWECYGVIVEGYLLGVTREHEEACNCGSSTYVDHHLWLAAAPSASKAASMVIEVSPRSWSSHPKWSEANTFRRSINAKARVRVMGWLAWDYEHKEQLGKTRRTLWEVHPIHSIQVLSGNRWVVL